MQNLERLEEVAQTADKAFRASSYGAPPDLRRSSQSPLRVHSKSRSPTRHQYEDRRDSAPLQNSPLRRSDNYSNFRSEPLMHATPA